MGYWGCGGRSPLLLLLHRHVQSADFYEVFDGEVVEGEFLLEFAAAVFGGGESPFVFLLVVEEDVGGGCVWHGLLGFGLVADEAVEGAVVAACLASEFLCFGDEDAVAAPPVERPVELLL